MATKSSEVVPEIKISEKEIGEIDKSSKIRYLCIDVFRGLAIVTMVFLLGILSVIII